MATFEIVVHPEWDLTERVVSGELTIAEVLAEVERFYNGGAITRLVLWDLSNAVLTSIRSGDVAQLAAIVAPLTRSRPGGKSATVAATDLGFGFSRMYQGYREVDQRNLPFMIFRTRQGAIDWLRSDAG